MTETLITPTPEQLGLICGYWDSRTNSAMERKYHKLASKSMAIDIVQSALDPQYTDAKKFRKQAEDIVNVAYKNAALKDEDGIQSWTLFEDLNYLISTTGEIVNLVAYLCQFVLL